jgi:sterol desaturase/sphingolipid hydroxylase (fatty acid hydroxylase superfamily)
VNALTSGLSQAVALVGYFAFSVGLIFAITIANRHILSPVASRRLPAIAALTGAITLAGLTLLFHVVTLLSAAVEVAAFSLLLWGLLSLARTASNGHTGIAAAAAMVVIGMLCLKVFVYAR